MKKTLLLILVVSSLASCGGPRRMSCYGKRCVEVNKKPQPSQNQNNTKTT